jgi:hypothetical protein
MHQTFGTLLREDGTELRKRQCMESEPIVVVPQPVKTPRRPLSRAGQIAKKTSRLRHGRVNHLFDRKQRRELEAQMSNGNVSSPIDPPPSGHAVSHQSPSSAGHNHSIDFHHSSAQTKLPSSLNIPAQAPAIKHMEYEDNSLPPCPCENCMEYDCPAEEWEKIRAAFPPEAPRCEPVDSDMDDAPLKSRKQKSKYPGVADSKWASAPDDSPSPPQTELQAGGGYSSNPKACQPKPKSSSPATSTSLPQFYSGYSTSSKACQPKRK